MQANNQRIILGVLVAAVSLAAMAWVAGRGSNAQQPAGRMPNADRAAAPLRETPQVQQQAACVVPAFPACIQVGTHSRAAADSPAIVLCQACGDCAWPCACGPRPLCAVECPDGCYCEGHEPRWHDQQPTMFDLYGPGEYVGPARAPHVMQYRIRVDDQLEFVYRLTREETRGPYKLEIGDQIRVESLIDENLTRDLVVQPDGTVTVRLLGQVRAAGRTVQELTDDLEERYKKFYKVPSITVTPLKVNTRLEDLRDSVDARFGAGGQSRQARVTPEGTVQLPAIGSVPAQGLTLDELKREVDERYAAIVQGIEVTPVLVARAPRFVYVLGEVLAPGRYELTGPTTAMQAVAMAGGWNNGGNLRQMVIFRRGDDWRLMATRLDLRGAMLGKRPCPADELWLRDSDIVLVPKSAILLADDFIELVFTRGIYGAVPFQGISINFAKLSSL